MILPSQIEFRISKPKIPVSKDNSVLIMSVTIIALVRFGGNKDAVSLKKMYYLYELVEKRINGSASNTLLSSPYDIPGHLRGVIMLLVTSGLLTVVKKGGKVYVTLTETGKERCELALGASEYEGYFARIQECIRNVTEINLEKQQLRW